MTSHEHHSNVPAPRRSEDGYTRGTSEAGDRILARIQELHYLAARTGDTIVIGPHGQNLTVAKALSRAEQLDAQIEMDQLEGSLRHRKVRLLTKLLTLLAVAVVDLPIMLWLASSVFNVDWAHPFGLPMVISVVVSVLATGGAATALHHLGHNQRQHKNDRRQLEWARLSAGAKVSLGTVGLLVALMGVVMFVRVYTEGVLSGFDDLAALLAVLVAVVLVVSALLVFWTAFRDGSLVQDDLRHYSRRVLPHLEGKRRYEDRAQELAGQYELMRNRVERARLDSDRVA
jgi:hypothetical protein